MRRPAFRFFLLAGAAALLLTGIYSSIRIAYADLLFRQNTSESVRRAVELDSGNAQYQAWLAERLENDGQDASPALERAAALNPLDSRVQIRRGLNAEARGDRATAERILLHAAAIDRLMEPRWTLLNFYFRGGEEEPFWRWAKETLAISYGSRAPVFELCWRMRADPAFIESRALPPQYAVQFQFMEFLLARDRPREATDLGTRIVKDASPSETKGYLTVIDKSLEAGNAADAAQLWNALCDRRLLAAGHAGSVVNGDFEHAPVGAGFDWRLPANPGISPLRLSAPACVRFTLNGQQPESCELISQMVLLQARRAYYLKFSYRTRGVQTGSGLRMRALDRVTPELAAEEWTAQSLEFLATDAGAGKIALEYRRPPGFPRMEGTVELRGVSVELAR